MKTNWKKRLICWAIPLAAGALSALLAGGMDIYKTINQPPLSPPGWVFPVVWTVLYLLMGEASYRVLTSGADEKKIRSALIAYGVQLVLNVLWSPIFFRFQWFLAAFILLLVLLGAIFVTLRKFCAIDERSGDLLIPYFLWVSFAGYLNLGVFLLN